MSAEEIVVNAETLGSRYTYIKHEPMPTTAQLEKHILSLSAQVKELKALLAPIKSSGDTGELRERVALEIRDWPFPINQHEGCLELADAILDIIQSERVG